MTKKETKKKSNATEKAEADDPEDGPVQKKKKEGAKKVTISAERTNDIDLRASGTVEQLYTTLPMIPFSSTGFWSGNFA